MAINAVTNILTACLPCLIIQGAINEVENIKVVLAKELLKCPIENGKYIIKHSFVGIKAKDRSHRQTYRSRQTYNTHLLRVIYCNAINMYISLFNPITFQMMTPQRTKSKMPRNTWK